MAAFSNVPKLALVTMAALLAASLPACDAEALTVAGIGAALGIGFATAFFDHDAVVPSAGLTIANAAGGGRCLTHGAPGAAANVTTKCDPAGEFQHFTFAGESLVAVTTPAAEGAPDGDLALCLDVGAGEGGAVTFTECTGDVNQRFGSLLGDTIDKAEPNAFAITGRRGTDFEGLCLTAQDDGSLSMMECPEVIPESSTGDVEVNLGALWLFPALILPLDPASA